MPVSLHRIALAAALLAPVTHSALAEGQARARALHDSITVTTLTFPGAEHVSPDDLRRLLFTRGSNCRLPFLIPLCKVSPSQLFTDRRRTTSAALGDDILKLRVYFWRRGYREAQIDTVLMPEPRGMAVAFHVVEGPPTNLSALIVQQRAPVLSEYELASLVELRDGGPCDFVALDSTLAHLKATIWNKGYADVRIDTAAPPPDASHVVPLRITIDPRWLTRVGRVEFEGNRYLSDETLQRGILLQPGTLYTHDAVLESQKRLFASPAIARAMVVTPPAGDSLKIVTVAIAESPQRHACARARRVVLRGLRRLRWSHRRCADALSASRSRCRERMGGPRRRSRVAHARIHRGDRCRACIRGDRLELPTQSHRGGRGVLLSARRTPRGGRRGAVSQGAGVSRTRRLGTPNGG